MTLEEACRLIDPATDLDALAEIEYYNGFKGKDAAAKALHEASQMVVDFVRQMSWHDAKNPPIAHEESWECAGEKHCAVISDIVWVCCESGHTMKGWVNDLQIQPPTMLHPSHSRAATYHASFPPADMFGHVCIS